VTDPLWHQGRGGGGEGGCINDVGEVELRMGVTVLAVGGISGNLTKVREEWGRDCYGEACIARSPTRPDGATSGPFPTAIRCVDVS